MRTAIQISAVAITLLWSCKQAPLPTSGEALHREAGRRLCAKMVPCLRSYTRTLREESRRTITVEACMESVEQRLSHFQADAEQPTDVALARDCYEKELALDCREFLLAPFKVPSCRQLVARSQGMPDLPLPAGF